MLCLFLKILFVCLAAAALVTAFGFWALNRMAAWQEEAEYQTGENE